MNKDILCEQGWCRGESILLPPMWPGFDSRTRCHMWVEFVVSSRPCYVGFSPGSRVFLPPRKPAFLNSNSTRKQWTKNHSVDVPLEFTFIIYLFVCPSFQEVAEIVRLTSSNVWSDRKDGVLCLQSFLLNSGVVRYVALSFLYLHFHF